MKPHLRVIPGDLAPFPSPLVDQRPAARKAVELEPVQEALPTKGFLDAEALRVVRPAPTTIREQRRAAKRRAALVGVLVCAFLGLVMVVAAAVLGGWK